MRTKYLLKVGGALVASLSTAHVMANAVVYGPTPVHFLTGVSPIFTGSEFLYGSVTANLVLQDSAFVAVDSMPFKTTLIGNSIVVGGIDPFYPNPAPSFLSAGNQARLFISGGSAANPSGLQVNSGGLKIEQDFFGSVVGENNARIQTSGNTQVGTGLSGLGTPGPRGVLSLDTGSVLNQINSNLFIGAATNANGSMTMSGGSVVNVVGSGIVGIAHDGIQSIGTGRLVANGSIINSDVVIGTNGYLGGNATINGDVTNYGTINPGNSPGRILINGSLTSGVGSQIVLEVVSNGLGGYNTDQLVFTSAAALGQLGNAPITFSFLGATNAQDFFASLAYNVDTFFKIQSGAQDLALSSVASQPLIDSFFGATAFQYITPSNFTPTLLNQSAGAQFVGTATSQVPLPGGGMLLSAGLLALGLNRNKRCF
jgi:hypothetical protein